MKRYSAVIQEYLQSNHTSLSNSNEDYEGFYLTHQGIIKNSSSTTKLKLDFDASAESTSGVSLNKILMVRPTTQDDLFSLLIRFCCHNYVLIANIEKCTGNF